MTTANFSSEHPFVAPEPVTFIAYYLMDVLHHLYQQEPTNNLSLLLISNEKTGEEVQKLLEDMMNSETIFKNMAQFALITILSPTKFIKTHFDKRYDLACFIDDNAQNTTSKDISQSMVAKISTRLRDLFAKQCIVITNTTIAQEVNMRSFGYVLASSGLSTHKTKTQFDHYFSSQQRNDNDNLPTTSNKNNDLSIWQFNLYDYKPEPDWLNAKYWANPENFDKYRW